MPTTHQSQPGERTFVLFQQAQSHIVMSCAFGALALCGAAAGMFFAIALSVDMMTLHLITTVPAMIGIGALLHAWKLSRTPKSVTVGSRGLVIERKHDSQSLLWDEIGWANLQDIPLSTHKQLIVYDNTGRTLIRLTDAISDFKQLVELIQSHVAARPDTTADDIRRRKARRTGLIFIAIGVFWFVAAGFLLRDAREQDRAEALLAEQGVPAEAEIVERFLAPDGVTPRLEYHIAGPNGYSETRNAELTRAYWDLLEGAATVPVVYVPDEPDISRLQMGEVAGQEIFDSPRGRKFVVFGLFAMALFFVAGGAMTFSGWDIKFDSDTKKFSLKRYGA